MTRHFCEIKQGDFESFGSFVLMICEEVVRNNIHSTISVKHSHDIIFGEYGGE